MGYETTITVINVVHGARDVLRRRLRALAPFDRVETGPARKLEGATLNLNHYDGKVFPRFCVGQEIS